MKAAPTRWVTLLTIAAVCAILAFALLSAVAVGSSVPRVPLLATLTVSGIAIALGLSARWVKRRVGRNAGERRLHPLAAARWVALAFASSRVASALAGVYAGWFVASLTSGDGLVTQFARERAIGAGITALFAVAAVGAALALERALRLSEDEHDPPPGAADAPDLGSPA